MRPFSSAHCFEWHRRRRPPRKRKDRRAYREPDRSKDAGYVQRPV
jgi:hypothetical protein